MWLKLKTKYRLYATAMLFYILQKKKNYHNKNTYFLKFYYLRLRDFCVGEDTSCDLYYVVML